jgi:hypothetical protein
MESNEEKYVDNVRKLTKKIKQSVGNNNHSFISSEQIDAIERKLINHHRLMSNDKRYLFSMKIDDKYFGDFEAYKIFFVMKLTENTIRILQVKIRFVTTHQPSDEVWGRVDTLGFNSGCCFIFKKWI